MNATVLSFPSRDRNRPPCGNCTDGRLCYGHRLMALHHRLSAGMNASEGELFVTCDLYTAAVVDAQQVIESIVTAEGLARGLAQLDTDETAAR